MGWREQIPIMWEPDLCLLPPLGFFHGPKVPAPYLPTCCFMAREPSPVTQRWVSASLVWLQLPVCPPTVFAKVAAGSRGLCSRDQHWLPAPAICGLSRHSLSAAPSMQPFPPNPVHTAKLTSHPDLCDRAVSHWALVFLVFEVVWWIFLFSILFHDPCLQPRAILPTPLPYSPNPSSFVMQSDFLEVWGPQLLFTPGDLGPRPPGSLYWLIRVFP